MLQRIVLLLIGLVFVIAPFAEAMTFELAQQIVNQAYREILSREPDPSSIGWINALASDSISVEQLWSFFADSTEGQTATSVLPIFLPSDDPTQATTYAPIINTQPFVCNGWHPLVVRYWWNTTGRTLLIHFIRHVHLADNGMTADYVSSLDPIYAGESPAIDRPDQRTISPFPHDRYDGSFHPLEETFMIPYKIKPGDGFRLRAFCSGFNWWPGINPGYAPRFGRGQVLVFMRWGWQ